MRQALAIKELPVRPPEIGQRAVTPDLLTALLARLDPPNPLTHLAPPGGDHRVPLLEYDELMARHGTGRGGDRLQERGRDLDEVQAPPGTCPAGR